MRKVLLFGATGQLGVRIVKKLAEENWTVSAFVRSSSDIQQLTSVGAHLIVGNVNNADDIVKAFSNHYDLVISSLGASLKQPDTISKGISNIVQHFNAEKLIAVGGAGLLPDLQYGQQFRHPSFPSVLKPIAVEHWKAYQAVTSAGINFVYLCPPRMTPGNFSDPYKLCIEEPVSSPSAFVSLEACAAFIVKEAREKQFFNKRIGIINN